MMQPKNATPNAHVSEWKRLWEQQNADNEAVMRSEKYGLYPVHAEVLVWAREHYHDTPYFVKAICPTASSQYNRSPNLVIHQHTGLEFSSSSSSSVMEFITFISFRLTLIVVLVDYNSKFFFCSVMLGWGQRIPSAFIKDHFRELQQGVTLQNGDGKAWKVWFRCAEKYPFWHKGWRAFSQDNSLQVGDNIVFALVANSQFLFTVFDKHGIMKKNFDPVIKNHHTPNSSKTQSTDEDEDSDDHRSLAALALKRKYSRRASAAPVKIKVEENAESDVRVVESSDIEEAEAEEEEEEVGLKVLNPPVEKEHDERGVYNRSSELGKDRRHVSSEILEHPCKLRPFMSIYAQAERGAATGSNIKKTHLNEEGDTFFHEIPAVGCQTDVRDQDDRVGNDGKRAETRSDDIVMNAAQRSLGRNGGNYGAGHKEVVMERSRPMTRSATVGQQSLASQQPSRKVKRACVELGFSEGRKHTAEAEEGDQSNRDQSNFVQAKDDGMMQVPKLKLDWKQEINLLSHYFRSKRRTPTRLERQSAAQAAETYARSLRALNFVMAMAEFDVYTDFQLVSRQSLCLSATSFCKAPFRRSQTVEDGVNPICRVFACGQQLPSHPPNLLVDHFH